MNELTARTALMDAVGATGAYGHEKQFWGRILTALYGVTTSARTEAEFLTKLAEGLGGGEIALVRDGDTLTGTGGSFEPTVVNGDVTGGTWTAA